MKVGIHTYTHTHTHQNHLPRGAEHFMHFVYKPGKVLSLRQYKKKNHTKIASN